MKMCEEDSADFEPRRKAYHLTLGSLTDIEEKSLPISPEKDSTRIAFCCGNCTTRAEKR